jgi:hypothetical protein
MDNYWDVKKSIFLSFLVHIAVIAILLTLKEVPIPVEPKESGVVEVELEEEKGGSPRLEKITESGEKPCINYFYGIGVFGAMLSNGDFYVNNIVEDLPAFKHKIQIGDTLRPLNDNDIAGNEIKVVDILVVNRGIIKKIRREKICSD